MLKIKSISTVGFVGESENLVHELTCPLSRKRTGDRFYYKSSLYRVEAPDDANVRVVVFSAVDVFCCFETLVDLVDFQKCVLYLTDVKKARRMGIKIDKTKGRKSVVILREMLSFSLSYSVFLFLSVYLI